jgi:prevent-host-death family protein
VCKIFKNIDLSPDLLFGFLQIIENKWQLPLVLCKLFKLNGLMRFSTSDKNTRRFAGLSACVVSIIWGVSRGWSGFAGGSMVILVMIVMEVSMVTEVNAVSFRQNLGEMLNQVQYRNDSIVINKDGKPVAALVDADLFARIRRMQERFDELSQRIAAAYAGVAMEEGLAEIDAAVTRERRG